jgi:hypothetical protein
MSTGRANFGPYEDTWGAEEEIQEDLGPQLRQAIRTLLRESGVLEPRDNLAIEALWYLDVADGRAERGDSREWRRRAGALMEVCTESGLEEGERLRRRVLAAVLFAYGRSPEDLKMARADAGALLATRASTRLLGQRPDHSDWLSPDGSIENTEREYAWNATLRALTDYHDTRLCTAMEEASGLDLAPISRDWHGRAHGED